MLCSTYRPKEVGRYTTSPCEKQKKTLTSEKGLKQSFVAKCRREKKTVANLDEASYGVTLLTRLDAPARKLYFRLLFFFLVTSTFAGTRSSKEHCVYRDILQLAGVRHVFFSLFRLSSYFLFDFC